MATVANCYYCRYPLPPQAIVCPECGGGSRISDPVREAHRTITNTWILLGLALLLLSPADLIQLVSMVSGRSSVPPGLEVWGALSVIPDAVGVPVGVAAIVVAIIAKRRRQVAPRFPMFLTLCVLLFFLAKAGLVTLWMLY